MKTNLLNLERFHQFCSDAVTTQRAVAFLSFGGVLARLQVAEDMRPRQSLAKKTKILTPHRYIISVKALTHIAGNSVRSNIGFGV